MLRPRRCSHSTLSPRVHLWSVSSATARGLPGTRDPTAGRGGFLGPRVAFPCTQARRQGGFLRGRAGGGGGAGLIPAACLSPASRGLGVSTPSSLGRLLVSLSSAAGARMESDRCLEGTDPGPSAHLLAHSSGLYTRRRLPSLPQLRVHPSTRENALAWSPSERPADACSLVPRPPCPPRGQPRPACPAPGHLTFPVAAGSSCRPGGLCTPGGHVTSHCPAHRPCPSSALRLLPTAHSCPSGHARDAGCPRPLSSPRAEGPGRTPCPRIPTPSGQPGCG